MLLGLAVGTALASVVALGGTQREAEAAFTEKIVFASNRTTGTGVDNPTGDYEVFKMNPDGTGLRQLTFNEVDEEVPTLSPNGKKIAYTSRGVQDSNPQGDYEVYVMNASDGSAQKNLTNNGASIRDDDVAFSPDGKKIAYPSTGVQPSNSQGDREVYVMNALDGSAKKNLSNNGLGVEDTYGDFSPNSTKIAYTSRGIQTSNPQGDYEVYVMNASDGKGKKNLTNNGADIDDYTPVFSPSGAKIAYESQGKQISNEDGDSDIYRMSALDGSAKKNLTNNGLGITDRYPVFSPDGAKIAYESYGAQPSNLDGDDELYRMNTLDGLGQKNLSDNTDGDYSPAWGVQAT